MEFYRVMDFRSGQALNFKNKKKISAPPPFPTPSPKKKIFIKNLLTVYAIVRPNLGSYLVALFDDKR